MGDKPAKSKGNYNRRSNGGAPNDAKSIRPSDFLGGNLSLIEMSRREKLLRRWHLRIVNPDALGKIVGV